MPLPPLLSVWFLTYNHGPFVREALDSVLAQEVDFPWEICIGEDDSHDGTREICEEYAAKHPDLIRLFRRTRADAAAYGKRVIGRPNGLETLAECRGKYVAFLEGDDYWSDTKKLQRQVDFLERFPDYAATFHNVEDLFEGQRTKRFNYERSAFTADDFVDSLICRTLSVVARHSAVWPLPKWARETWILDYNLFWHVATQGKFHYFPEVMGVYRIHSAGMWTGATDLFRGVSGFQTYSIFRDAVSSERREEVDRKLMRLALWNLKNAARAGSVEWFLKSAAHIAPRPVRALGEIHNRIFSKR